MSLAKLLTFVIDNSLLLLLGALAGLLWANLSLTTYEPFAHALHFIVNDIGMVFFFAIAAKEVVEATLPGGPLQSRRRAAVPLFAAIGGMVAPGAAPCWLGALGRPARTRPGLGDPLCHRHRL